jgi:hypothetical protein
MSREFVGTQPVREHLRPQMREPVPARDMALLLDWCDGDWMVEACFAAEEMVEFPHAGEA